MTSPDVRMWLVCAAAALGAAPAAAGPVIADYTFTGRLTDVYDEFGVFGGLGPGDAVSGRLRIVGPQPTPDFVIFGGRTFGAEYTFPGGPGGSSIRQSVGSLDLVSDGPLVATVWNPAVVLNLSYDFYSEFPTPASFDASGLPAGYTLGPSTFAGLSLALRDRSRSTYPDVPGVLDPLSRYADISLAFAGGFDVEIRDETGEFYDAASVFFRLTSLTPVPPAPVPAPPSWAVLWLLGVLGAGWRGRRRRLAAFGLAAGAAGLAAGPAAAGPIDQNYAFTGRVSDVYDEFGVFGGLGPGDAVSGRLHIVGPQPAPRFTVIGGRPFAAGYAFPGGPGGSALRQSVGPIDLVSDGPVTARVANPAVSVDPFVSFTARRPTPASFDASGLPAGYTLGPITFFGLGMVLRDTARSTYPDVPNALDPLGQYTDDSLEFAGNVNVEIRDETGDTYDLAIASFRLTSLTPVPAAPVPAPPSWVLLWLLGVLGAGWRGRRRLVRQLA